jgi:GLPGLI family protein
MRHSFFLLILFCSLAHQCRAQSYNLTYKVTRNNNLKLDYAEKTTGETREILLAQHYAIKTAEVLYNGSVSLWRYTDEITYPDSYRGKHFPFTKKQTIYRNHVEAKQLLRDDLLNGDICKELTMAPMDYFEITDSIKIQDETLLQKGVLTGKEEIYVWFAPDIPIPEGPYNMAGMPGLVFEYNDKNLRYTLLSIKKVSEDAVTIEPFECSKVVSPKDYSQSTRSKN